MITKSFRLFGRELFRFERDRSGNVFYEMLENKGFENSKDYLESSINNPILLTIISLRCKIYSQMRIRHVNEKGVDIKNSEVLKLLKTPNFFQSQQDFLYQLEWFKSAVGTNYTYQKKNVLSGEVTSIFNLIPSEIDLNDSHKVDSFIGTKGDLKKINEKTIKYKLDKTEHTLKLGDLIPFYDLSNGITKNSFMRSPSRLEGISKVVQNIDENLKSKNINLKMSQKYLATNQGNSNGVTPLLTEQDRKSIEGVLYDKSLNITNVPVDVKHLVSDFKKLFLDEMFANDALTCLLAFEMNQEVINYFRKASSLNSQEQDLSMINWIQNSIQTDADSDMDSFSQQWGLFEKGEKLVASYDHLPIMQKILKTKIETYKLFQESIQLSITNGMVTAQEAKVMDEQMRLNLKL